MSLSERIYRLLLKAYPWRYRGRYEEPMAQLFADQVRAADSWRKLARLWLRTLADLLRTLPARHVETPTYSLYALANTQSMPRVAWSLPAKKSIFFARCEASSFGRKWITTEDLLLGILREDTSVRDLVGGAAAVESMRREIEVRETEPRRDPPDEDLPLNEACKSALALAKEEAPQEASQATPRHLLAGLVRQEHTFAAQLLRRHGIDAERLRRDQ